MTDKREVINKLRNRTCLSCEHCKQFAEYAPYFCDWDYLNIKNQDYTCKKWEGKT